MRISSIDRLFTKLYDSFNVAIAGCTALLQSIEVKLMDERLRKMAESRYGQAEFLSVLFELALEEQWFDLQHIIQHDMAKAILADYSYEMGKGYLNTDVFYSNWEDVIDVGWQKFCSHTGLSMDKVNSRLQQLRDAI